MRVSVDSVVIDWDGQPVFHRPSFKLLEGEVTDEGHRVAIIDTDPLTVRSALIQALGGECKEVTEIVKRGKLISRIESSDVVNFYPEDIERLKKLIPALFYTQVSYQLLVILDDELEDERGNIPTQVEYFAASDFDDEDDGPLPTTDKRRRKKAKKARLSQPEPEPEPEPEDVEDPENFD